MRFSNGFVTSPLLFFCLLLFERRGHRGAEGARNGSFLQTTTACSLVKPSLENSSISGDFYLFLVNTLFQPVHPFAV